MQDFVIIFSQLISFEDNKGHDSCFYRRKLLDCKDYLLPRSFGASVLRCFGRKTNEFLFPNKKPNLIIVVYHFSLGAPGSSDPSNSLHDLTAKLLYSRAAVRVSTENGP
jgi:hypothetical protein